MVFAIKQIACPKVGGIVILFTVVELPNLSVVVKLLALDADRKTGGKHLLMTISIDGLCSHFLVRPHQCPIVFLTGTANTLDLDSRHEELVHGAPLIVMRPIIITIKMWQLPFVVLALAHLTIWNAAFTHKLLVEVRFNRGKTMVHSRLVVQVIRCVIVGGYLRSVKLLPKILNSLICHHEINTIIENSISRQLIPDKDTILLN